MISLGKEIACSPCGGYHFNSAYKNQRVIADKVLQYLQAEQEFYPDYVFCDECTINLQSYNSKENILIIFNKESISAEDMGDNLKCVIRVEVAKEGSSMLLLIKTPMAILKDCKQGVYDGSGEFYYDLTSCDQLMKIVNLEPNELISLRETSEFN